MLHKNEDKGRVRNIRRQPGEQEKNPASWIQKYLDLADMLIRRNKRKDDEDHDIPRAA